MIPRWYFLPLNPEPWAVGSISAGRKDGKLTGRISPDANLQAFQNAVRETLEDVKPLPEGKYKLEFYFWRQVIRYLDMGDRVQHRNEADVTNMQKGLEDALQGVLFDNDRSVVDVHSVIMEQGELVTPRIIIKAELETNRAEYLMKFPNDILDLAFREVDIKSDEPGKWAEGDELF